MIVKSSERLGELLRAFAADHQWIHDNLAVLLERYTEQWIAVKERQVIASALTLDDLLSALPDPAHTCVEFITREPLEMVLGILRSESRCGITGKGTYRCLRRIEGVGTWDGMTPSSE